MRRGGMDVQVAEFSAEGEMLLRRDVLVTEEDHQIFGERTMDLVHLAVGRRFAIDELADVDAGNLSTDDRRQLLDRDGLVRIGYLGLMPIARSLLARQRAHDVPPRSVWEGTW